MMKQFTRFFCGMLGLWLLLGAILLALKGVFVWFNWPSLHAASYKLMLDASWQGLRFEASTLGYLLSPAITFYYAAALTGGRIWKRILLGYMLAIVGLVLLIDLIDLQYFEESGKHLTYEATEYLNASAAPMVAGAFQVHHWLSTLSLLGCAGVLLASWWALRRLLWMGLPARGARVSLALAWTIPVWVGLLLLVIRGGTQMRPLRMADACISANPYINALVLEPVYAVLTTTRLSSKPEYNYYTEAENIRTTRRLLLGNDAADPPEPDYPLLQRSPGTPQGNHKNVVLFLLESWSGKDIGVLGGPAGVTPFFDELTHQGAFFDRFYATGIRTPEGVFSILCSFPNQPVRPIMKRRNVSRVQWRSLSLILAEAGYDTMFIHGRDLGFDHMDAFLKLNGFQRLIDRRAFPDSAPRANESWPGYDDEEVMRRANAEFVRQGDRPFLGVIYTMNTHAPFMTPENFPLLFEPDTVAKRLLNSLHYGDYTLKVFFDLAQKERYFANTMFILVADHARSRDAFNFDDQHRIPFLIYAPGHVAPKAYRVVGSQLDILPTVLGLLQLQTLHASWGQDLLNTPEARGFAMSVVGNEMRWHERSYLLNDSLGSKPPQLFDLAADPDCAIDVRAQYPDVAHQLQHKLRAYLSLSQTLLYADRVFPMRKAKLAAPAS